MFLHSTHQSQNSGTWFTYESARCPSFRITFPQKKDNTNLKNGERKGIHNIIDNLIQITPFKAYGENVKCVRYTKTAGRAVYK